MIANRLEMEIQMVLMLMLDKKILNIKDKSRRNVTLVIVDIWLFVSHSIGTTFPKEHILDKTPSLTAGEMSLKQKLK